MGGLRKTPIISLLFVVAMAAAAYLLAPDPTLEAATFGPAQVEAREYLVRHPRLEVDAVGESVLESDWLAQMRTAAARADRSLEVELPPRMLARSQARLDELIAAAYDARVASDPRWRHGVGWREVEPENLFLHAFVPASVSAVALAIGVLLLAGVRLERAWGSIVFGAFVLGAIPASALVYRLLDASNGVPTSGASGLVGALLGAYLIHGLGGRVEVPGWLLLPVWLTVEVFLIREVRFGDSTIVPWATLFAAVGLGALVAGALRFFGYEARVASAVARRTPKGPNPVVQRAARLRSDGDPYQALDLIQAAWRDDPTDVEISEAYYSIAVEVGQPEAAAEAILPQLREALKLGDLDRAVEYWFPLASKECDVVLEATASVRLGEALLDAGHPDEALFSLASALDAGVSPAHATRIVSIARDLDEGLTRRAAAIALHEDALDPKVRADLEALVTLQDAEPPPSEDPDLEALEGEEAVESRSQLDRRVHAEHQTVETTAFPLDLDSDFEPADPSALDFDESMDLAEPEPAAVSPANDDGPCEGREAESFSMNSGDVLSHWGRAEDDTDPLADVSGGLGVDAREEPLLEPDDLETPDLGFDFGLRSYGADLVDPREDETDTDLTPMMDATDELTSPMLKGQAARDAQNEDPATVIFDQAAAFVPATTATEPVLPETRILSDDAPPAPAVTTVSVTGSVPTPVPTPAPAQSPHVATPPPPVVDDEFAFGRTEEPATAMFDARELKAIEAVPLEAGDRSIEIDADERGKSKLPYSRIQAISIAAVLDLGPRPVLILDLVLNWAGDASEPLKLIRFRSDRFDPGVYVPSAENPLEALTTWIADLERRSGATCLPTRRVLEGEFTRFESLASYERDVLMATASR